MHRTLKETMGIGLAMLAALGLAFLALPSFAGLGGGAGGGSPSGYDGDLYNKCLYTQSKTQVRKCAKAMTNPQRWIYYCPMPGINPYYAVDCRIADNWYRQQDDKKACAKATKTLKNLLKAQPNPDQSEAKKARLRRARRKYC